MPIARFEMPDGRIARFEVPEGTTPEQAQGMIASSMQSVPQEKSWGDVAKGAILNAPGSTGKVLKETVHGLKQVVTHPLDTGMAVWDAAAGGLRNVLPTAVSSAIDKADEYLGLKDNTNRIQKTANVIGDEFKNKYGSTENFKNTLATDPAAVAADLSTILTGGATVLPKAGGIAAKVSAAGRAIDPLVLALKAGGKATDVVGNKILPKILGATTGAGEAALAGAYQAGKEGGEVSKAFASNMRGESAMTNVLDDVKQNLANMQAAKQAEYRKNIASMKQDKSVLSFEGVDQALADANGIVSFKGQVKNTKAADALNKIQEEVNAWKKLEPSEFHTPEGLDALKQKIGGLVEEIPFEQRTARLAAGKVYDAVKSEISKQAPDYAKTMKAYSEASDQIKEIEKALSAGQKASADTSMRKLQSLMRNNVNTNYGNRLELAKQLEEQGGNQILPQLAGQSLNSWAPRGIQGATAGTGGAGLALSGNIPAAAGVAALSSPRLMGEALHLFGSSKKISKDVANAMKDTTKLDPQVLANLLYQINKTNQEANKTNQE